MWRIGKQFGPFMLIYYGQGMANQGDVSNNQDVINQIIVYNVGGATGTPAPSDWKTKAIVTVGDYSYFRGNKQTLPTEFHFGVVPTEVEVFSVGRTPSL